MTSQDQTRKALLFFDICLVMKESLFGRNSHEYANTLQNKAVCYGKLQNNNEMIVHMRRALSIFQQTTDALYRPRLLCEYNLMLADIVNGTWNERPDRNDSINQLREKMVQVFGREHPFVQKLNSVISSLQ